MRKIDVTKLDDSELADIINRVQAEIESRKVEGQFDVFKPSIGESYCFFNATCELVCDYVERIDNADQRTGSFLIKRRTEEAAEKDGELWRLTKKIERRIAELNREHGWVCDWNDRSQKKFYIFIGQALRNIDKSFSFTVQELNTNHYMCEEALNEIEGEFTEAELRAFVNQEWVKS